MVTTISVAMCTHNGARFVAEQVRSILAQTVAVDELVVSDDDSSDDTIAVIEREIAAAATPPRLRVLRNNPALGVVKNFEQALTATSGELVALSDQDDVWHRDRIATALAVLKANPEVELVFGDARIVDGDGAPTGATLFGTLGVTDDERGAVATGRALDALVRRSLVTGATVLMRRELVERAVPFPDDWVHDEWLAVVAALTSGIAIAPGELIDYRIHGGNQIGVSRLAPAVAWRRLTEPRRARNHRMASAWADLQARLPALGDRVSTVDAQLVERKTAHEAARAGLPAGRGSAGLRHPATAEEDPPQCAEPVRAGWRGQ